MGRKRIRIRTSVLVTVLLASSLSLGTAQAGLMTIQGTIRDALGRPLKAVRVTDGAQSTYTDSYGYYKLEESSISTYKVTASRSGLNAQTKLVDPLTAVMPVDFTLTYVLQASVSPWAFNNDPPKTLSLSATSYAPVNGQCVVFVDMASGTQVSLALYSQSGSQSTWTGSYDVPSDRLDGRYIWELRSSDCESATQLTNVPSSAFIVDSIPPLMNVETLIPLDHGNTIFTSGQPLLANITDAGGSGVNPATILFTLTDETDPANIITTSHYPVSYSALTGWAKTTPQPLTDGHVYRMTVFAQDYASNASSIGHSEISQSGGFLAASIQLHSTNARIPPTPCRVSKEVDLLTGSKAVVCENVPLHLKRRLWR